MIVKRLSGLSGCEVLLCKHNDKVFVRKISASSSYNSRLKKQFYKQILFKNKTIKKPEIFSSGMLGEKFYFDMEFIKSETISQKIGGSISPEDLVNISDFFFKQIEGYPIVRLENATSIIREKLCSLKPSDAVENEAVFRSGIKWLSAKEWRGIPYSFCHGDMTLENILMGPKGEIYLIDFLDSFINTWLIDIAKVLQDLEIGWSWRNETQKNSNRELKCLIAKEFIINKLLSFGNGQEILENCYALLLLNMLRIYPYVTEKKTEGFLNNKVRYLLNLMKGM